MLHVISVISNPRKYKRRYELFKRFEAAMLRQTGVTLYVVELAFGERDHAITDKNNKNHLQLRTKHEIWHKENMINVAVQKLLPKDWRYVAWIDADIDFQNHNWVEDTIHALDHHPIVQLFQTCADLGPDGEIMKVHKGFAYQLCQNATRGKTYEFWHPGYAWAATRAAWDQMGGLIDWAILGSADHHMALSWIGHVMDSVHKDCSDEYKRSMVAYQKRCKGRLANLGFVKGTILHNWHGRKQDRRYIERWQILTANSYNPYEDIQRDSNGIYQLTDDKPKLLRQIQQYFEQRNEDGISL